LGQQTVNIINMTTQTAQTFPKADPDDFQNLLGIYLSKDASLGTIFTKIKSVFPEI